MPSLSIFSFSLLSLSSGVALAGVTKRGFTIRDTTTSTDALSGTHDGDITWYNTGGADGACGTALSDTQATCALGTALFDPYTPDGNPNQNTLCGMTIQITMSDGSTATAAVADRCVSCAEYDLDLTPVVFENIVPGGLDVGRTVASWAFL